MRFPIRLDNPFPPRVNYNRVAGLGKHVCSGAKATPEDDYMTQQKAMRIYNVVQELNFIREPQLALKKPAFGQRRHGLI